MKSVIFQHRRVVFAALGVAALLFVLGILFRPVWRDEYWSMFYAQPGASLSDFLNFKMMYDVHPPGSYLVLHFWLKIWDHELWGRLLNILFLIASSWGGYALRGERKQETLIFLFLMATSYWLSFYLVEVRMYGWVFILSGLLVLIARNALIEPQRWLRYALLFLALSIPLANFHLFGALWVSGVGAGIGLIMLKQGNWRGFLTFGAASIIAVLPVLLWIIFYRPDQSTSVPLTDVGFFDRLRIGLEQYLRGLTIKTFFVNPAVFIAAWFGLKALYREKEIPERDAIGLALLLTIIVAYAVHFVWTPWVKERALICTIPGIFYLATLAILRISPDQERGLKWARWIPGAFLVMIPLQLGELFRDHEQATPLKHIVLSTPECEGQPIIAYDKATPLDQEFFMYFTERALGVWTPPGVERKASHPTLTPHTALTPETLNAIESACPIKLVTVALKRGESGFHEAVREELRSVYPGFDELREVRIGFGRTRLWVDPESDIGRDR